jgi:hypothetical protein
MSSTVASNEGKGSTVRDNGNLRADAGAGMADSDADGDQGGERGSGPFNLTDKQKRLLVVVLVVHLILAKVTWLDLRRRPDAGVRGPKGLWRTWSFFNTTGSLAYWTIGRRRVRASQMETTLA